MFVDLDQKTVFYKINIPNITTSISYKNELLGNVSTLWEDFFSKDDKSNTEGSAATF
jgi:hypothetical protein